LDDKLCISWFVETTLTLTKKPRIRSKVQSWWTCSTICQNPYQFFHSQSPRALWRIVWFQSGVPLPAHKFPWNLSGNHKFHGICVSIDQSIAHVFEFVVIVVQKMRTWVLATRFDQQSFGFLILNSSETTYNLNPRWGGYTQPMEIWGKRVLVVVPVYIYNILGVCLSGRPFHPSIHPSIQVLHPGRRRRTKGRRGSWKQIA